MQTKHTPGPWKAVNTDSDIDCEIWGGRNESLVASLNGHNPFYAENARLIAAAPDLLAALERILYAHETGNNGASMGEAVLCEYFARMARAAINKAKGGE